MVPLLLATTYKLVPDADIEWKDVLVGAIITAVLFLLGKSVFEVPDAVSILGSVDQAAGCFLIGLGLLFGSGILSRSGNDESLRYA